MNSRVLRNHVRSGQVQPIAVKSNFGPVKTGRRVLGDISSQRNVIQNLGNLKIGATEKQKIKHEDNEEMETEDVSIISVVEDRVLPPGVVDIDTKDLENPQLCAEYATETYVYLRSLERRCLVRSMHLAGQQTNERMRQVLVDWLVEVQSQFKLLQETLHSTVEILDRYMAIEGKNVGKSKLQLVGVSAMFLAAKIEEMYAPACADFVYITDNAYTEQEIKAQELKVVRALEFNLSQPVSLNFLRRYSKAGDVDVLQHNLAKYFLECCLLEYSLVPVAGSQLAASSLCLSLLVTDPALTITNVWTPTLAYYSGYNIEDLLPIVKKIATAEVKLAKNQKFLAVKTKYKSSKFMKVADLEELKGDVLVGLANSSVRL